MAKYLMICVVLALVPALLLSGCAMVMTPVYPTGFLYTDVNTPGEVTSNEASPKSGTSSCVSYVGMVALGDASIETAKKNGGITKIHSVDYETFNILSLYSEVTVTVRGE